MNIGILGGTFDPIHLGHLLMAEMAREQLSLARVLFTPAGDPPHKQGVAITPAHHRRAMVELAIAGNPGFTLCDVDLTRPGPHYSTDTIRLVRRHFNLPPEQCCFIIGGDSLHDLPTWHNPQELISLCRLAVVHRPGYRPDMTALVSTLPGIQERVHWVQMPFIGLAASDIRARVRAGLSIRYQVPEAVEQYIRQYRLYR